MLVLVLALAFGLAEVLGLAWSANRVWNGAPYPVADPAATARRLDGHTQAVYDVLGLPDAELDTNPYDVGQTAGENCGYPGLGHVSAQLNGSHVPGVVTVSSSWRLRGVTRAQADSALARSRQALAGKGWQVTEYRNIHDRVIGVEAQPPGSGDRVHISAFPGDRFEVTAHAECARYPSKTSLDETGVPTLPAQQAPARLRG